MMKLIRPEERPRERCLLHGPECLSLREILAVQLGTGPRHKGCLGLASDFLKNLSGSDQEIVQERALLSTLRDGSLFSFEGLKGLQDAGKTRLLTCFDFARRFSHFVVESHAKTTSLDQTSLEKQLSDKVGDDLRHSRKEWIGFVAVYSDSKLGDFILIERGTRTHVNFNARELFAKLLPLRPEAFILIHNHPSGSSNASAEDRKLTEIISLMSRQLSTPLLGHWIVTSGECGWV